MNKILIATAIAAASITTASQACTSIAWNTDFGTLTTRTNDWVESTSPVLGTIKAGSKRYRHGVEGNGETFTTKYDIIAVQAYGGLVHDGVNSEGMQVNGLYYSPMTMDGKGKNSISQFAFGEYLISQFATIEEVVNNLETIKTEMVSHPTLPKAPTFHWSLTDKTGDRLVIEHDKDGITLYRGKEAAVMTNQPSQQVHLNAWKKASSKFSQPSANVNYGSTGNNNSRDRFLYSSYYSEQLKQPSSSFNGMMKLAGTAFRVPHDAANTIENGVITGYATEWQLTQNLTTGKAIWQYTWNEAWTQVQFNFYDILNSGKQINFNLDNPALAGDITAQIIATGQ
ncbi:linear amide C-N hydrolase [Photobacterium sp. SDRW27]|uniref:linear amide C-N hydrolase n=1 Tax=Photobacterium obscurum TaxID=2829490 RepID=UPI0022448A3B|nr:linear amide C-N hydrolase [Photobacterium obscurum]MCW8329036.1 linear amide C-N hydrolase [Photobacterium obscurum]